MSSKAAIVNMALGDLGISTEVNDVDTENSKEAQAARRYWQNAVDCVLRDFPWPFATRRAALALVETDPTDVWGYAYRYPADALAVRTIESGVRPESRASFVPYEVVSDDDGQLLYTSASDTAVITYTARIDDPELFPPDFVEVLRYKLAADMAARLTKGDEFKLGDRALVKYQWAQQRAWVNAAAEIGRDTQPRSEFEAARD